MIIPSIDLMNGKVVQLENGEKKKIELDNPIEIAKKYSVYGEIAVIDIDAAMNKGSNIKIIKEICKFAKCRVGGGIRTVEKAKELIGSGAQKLIIGTAANKDLLSQIPKEKIIVAIDSKEGKVVDNGWTNKTNKTPKDRINELKDYCFGFLFTDVEREGLMKGFDLAKVDELKTNGTNITVAGGISSIGEIKTLDKEGFDVQLGMSLYTGKIDIDDAFVEMLDFKKQQGKIPTIVQDTKGEVLMLAYSTKESLKISFKSRRGVYFSRSRNEIWKKGETSGNTQELKYVRYDCDKDTLLFIVKQKGKACHKNNYSCFGNSNFGLEDLYNVIESKKIDLKNKSEDFKKSYTDKLLLDDNLLKRKIIEEAGEIVTFDSRENLIWEIGDITYFLMVLMVKNNISIQEILWELEKRRK